MKKTLTLGIPRPCTESWADMTPENQGRFCGSCQKTVVDFTAMTDHELLQWFTHHHGAVCGRFTPDQLARPITTLPKTSHNRWRYWQYIIAGLLFSAKVSAQTKPVRPQTTQYLPIGLDNTLKGDTILIADKVPPPDSLRKSIAVATGSLTGFVG